MVGYLAFEPAFVDDTGAGGAARQLNSWALWKTVATGRLIGYGSSDL
ncbi:MAG: hypothetical protein M3N95_08745 [Actinomycetota bacterium]|nr:hypothetical protein [Actinomycetota bacterium]